MPAMYFDLLPYEIITQIFLSLPTVSSALALSSTSHTFRDVYQSSKRLEILSQAIEQEYGPSNEITQLLTHNASQPAHIRRTNVPISDALIKQMVSVGRVAARYTDLYPLKKWSHGSHADRRLLTPQEAYALRRALYRLWLFTRAFHNSTHVRTTRSLPQNLYARAALLHNFSTPELAEMLDVQLTLRSLVAEDICPSNGSIRHEFRKRHPDSSHQLLFNSATPNINIHLNYPHHSTRAGVANSKYHATRTHEPGFEGWGDDIGHYYVVEDMMKLDPAQILWLREECPMKWQVEGFVQGLGEWFQDNGETFSETLGFVVGQRGGEWEEFKEGVEEGVFGIVGED